MFNQIIFLEKCLKLDFVRFWWFWQKEHLTKTIGMVFMVLTKTIRWLKFSGHRRKRAASVISDGFSQRSQVYSMPFVPDSQPFHQVRKKYNQVLKPKFQNQFTSRQPAARAGASVYPTHSLARANRPIDQIEKKWKFSMAEKSKICKAEKK